MTLPERQRLKPAAAASILARSRAACERKPAQERSSPNWLRRAPFTDSKLETQMGDIVVYVPEGLGVNVRAAVEAARGYGIAASLAN